MWEFHHNLDTDDLRVLVQDEEGDWAETDDYIRKDSNTLALPRARAVQVWTQNKAHGVSPIGFTTMAGDEPKDATRGKTARRLSERDELAVMAVLCLSSASAATFALLTGSWLVPAFYMVLWALMLAFAKRAPLNRGDRH